VVVQTLLRKQETQEIKSVLSNLLKQVPVATPTAAPAPVSSPSTNQSGAPRSQKEQELEKQLIAMGYSQTQAREALWATGYRGIEQAVDFLLSQM
jgi:hypothetical protein